MIKHNPQANVQKSPEYLSRYGLTCDPFSVEYQAEFFLVDDERSKRLNILNHLIQHSDLLLLVTGPRGIGKSALLQHFCGMASELWVTCKIHSHTMLHPDVLYRHICEAFKIQPAERTELTRANLKARLSELIQGDYIPILLVDDAHELPAESLREIIMLAEMSVDNSGLLRTVLFSEPQIDRILETPLLRDIRNRITHTLDMPCFNEQQTYQYIKHRLVTAGLHGDVPISDKNIQKIHRQSGGIPLAINQLTVAELAEIPASIAVTRTMKPLRSKRPLKPIFLLLSIILIAILVTAAIIHDVSTRLWKDTPTTWANDNSQRVTPKISINKPSPISPEASPAAEPEAPATPETLPLVEANPGVSADAGNNDNPQQDQGSEANSNTAPDVAVLVEIPAYSSKDDREEKHLETTQPPTASPQVEASPVVKPDTPVATGISSGAKPAEAAPTPTNTAPVQVAEADRPATPKPAAPANPARLQGIAWLRAQDANHYTIQLTASRSEKAMLDYINLHQLADSATYVRTTLTGKDWFILLQGSYKDKTAATNAINQLPAALLKVKPWSRRLGDISPAAP